MDKKESRTLRLHFYDFKHLPIQEPLRLFNNLNRLTLTRMKNVYLSLFALMLVASSFAQSSFGPVDSGTLTYVGKTIPLRDMPTMEVTDSDELCDSEGVVESLINMIVMIDSSASSPITSS